MHLRPSRIYFSQDSISNRFGRSTEHAGVMIGETLDDILTGECSIYDIDPIEVERQNGVYRTADNRRLWIFKKLEELGECTTIPICLISAIDSSAKCETEKTIRVRGDPGGYLWRTWGRATRRRRYAALYESDSESTDSDSDSDQEGLRYSFSRFSMSSR